MNIYLVFTSLVKVHLNLSVRPQSVSDGQIKMKIKTVGKSPVDCEVPGTGFMELTLSTLTLMSQRN